MIRLVEIEGEAVFDTENLGLTPFTPLMKPPAGMDGVQWAIRCDERTKALSLPTYIRSNLLASQWIMGGLIHPKEVIGALISEEIMQESSFFEYLSDYFDETRGKEHFQRGIQQGIQQGSEQAARQIAIKNLYSVLEFRFNGPAVQALRPAVESIEDLQHLEELHREALRAESFEAFAGALGVNGDER